MIIETVNEYDLPTFFDSKAVIAFKKGKQLQYSTSETETDWIDWEIYDNGTFGPWCYNRAYKWRVKPDEIEVEIEREVKTVVKSTVKIPAPFKGTIAKSIDYFVVKHSTYRKNWWACECQNFEQDCADFDVKNHYVYLDKETAQKAVDILNAKTGESK